MPTDINAVFVYGTLQRGEQRERCWPCPPLQVTPATIRGILYDIGPYPALASGSDTVAGELWTLRPEDLDVTLRELDAIECFGQGGVDLYVRRAVECQTAAGEVQRAFTYFIADNDYARQHPRVPPGEDGLVRWHRCS
jgi:gamma-glutamylcyclotransferase (GGCT)/AIG2-like uncharacterized protein YtfP